MFANFFHFKILIHQCTWKFKDEMIDVAALIEKLSISMTSPHIDENRRDGWNAYLPKSDDYIEKGARHDNFTYTSVVGYHLF